MSRASMFRVADFITESNKIDPQYDESGILIPGSAPGEPMFDNQIRVIDLLPELMHTVPVPSSLPLIIHRELTRGIPIFEDRGQSGAYRKCDVYIGGEKAPAPYIAIDLIENLLMPHIQELQGKEVGPEDALREAWWCHNLFEVAHGFVDGNGRSGRLLLNAVLQMLGHERITIWYEQRMLYYDKIREFRKTDFPKLLEQRTQTRKS
jgi:fido (protein-threonine AMPylation protein)